MKAHSYVILAGICLGMIGPLMKLIGDSVPVMTVSFLRMGIAALVLMAVLPFMDRSVFRPGRDLKHYALLGLLIAVDFTLYMAAFTLAPISNVVIITYMFPVFLAIISSVFFRERLTRAMALTFIIAFAGLAIINPFNPDYMVGSLIALANALLYAVLYAYMRYIDKKHTIGVVFWFVLFAALFLSPAPLIYGLGGIASALPWIILLGLVSTAGAYIFLNMGLERLGAERVSLMTMTVEPLVAIGVSVSLLSGVLSLPVVLGGCMVIAAGLVLNREKAK